MGVFRDEDVRMQVSRRGCGFSDGASRYTCCSVSLNPIQKTYTLNPKSACHPWER